MRREMTKPEKIALCRECHGTGILPTPGVSRECPNCEGSGRVIVSCQMTLDIRPYKVSK